MQGISIFQQIYAPRVAHVVTGFDGVSHNTHSPYAIGGVVGSVGKMTAIVANDQADTWHIVNLKCGKIFDAVAVLGAFDESEAANMAMRYHGQYFDAVCGDVCESNTGGLQRFLNHPVYMRTNRPVYAEELAKLQDIPSTQAILWDGVQLKSHNGSSKHLLLDMMRCDDDKALLEKMDFVEEESQLDGEIAEYDALVVEAYKLEGTVSKLALAMDKATSISTLKVAKQTLSKPKTMRGFGVIQQLVSFELSDGQAVSIIFNVSDSEANASAKMTKDDLLVAWKYKLNSRDITAAVQPNATQNVSLNMIASRIMGLADANSEKFVAAQKKKDAMQTELANTNQQVKDLQSQEQALLQEIADLQKQLDEKAKNNKALEVIKQNNLKGISENGYYASLTFSDEKQKFVKTTVYLENKDLPKNGDYIVVTYEIDKRNKDPKSIGGVVDYGGDYDKILDVYANDNVNKYGFSLLQRGTISKRLKKEIADLEAEKESKFIDDPKKKLGDEDKFTLPTNSTVILDLPITEYRPEKMRVVEREAENATFYEVDAFSENMSKWINLKSYTDKEKAILGAKGWYPEIITEEENKPQERPLNWRTNLANARDVAKSLGIETKGKKLVDLLTEIDQKDTEPKATISNLSDDEYKAKEAKPLAPVEKAQQAKKDAFLNTEVDSAYGTVTKKQLLDNLINDGWTLSTGWTEDKAKGKALDTELDRLKRTAPWGNTSHPDTIRLNELKNLAKESPHKDYGRFFFKETVYHLESPTGELKSLSKTELDYINDALAKKETQPKATTVSNKKSVFEALTQYGWTVDSVSGGISKTFAGIAEAGSVSNGERTLSADFDSKERYLAVTDNNAPTGGKVIPETEIDLRDYGYDTEGFAKAAKAFNEKVEVYVLNQREALNAPKTNPDRDYLQSIIDGKADLEAKGITAKIREIVLRAKNASDTEMLALANTAANTAATQLKANAAKKMAEVQ